LKRLPNEYEAKGGFEMIVVMQCAKRMSTESGEMLTPEGQKVKFVARPNEVPPKPGVHYAHPDDNVPGTDRTWREEVIIYNLKHNPSISDAKELLKAQLSDPSDQACNLASDYNDHSKLLPAGELYTPKPYSLLADAFGPKNFYVLSLGMGLVRSDFMIPVCRMAFASSHGARPHEIVKQKEMDHTKDINMLPDDVEGPVVLLAGLKYLSWFCELTDKVQASRIICHVSKHVPEDQNYELCEFETRAKTNWHYSCAKALAEDPQRFIKGLAN